MAADTSTETTTSFATREIPPEITLPAPDDYTGTVSITPQVAVQGNRYEVEWRLDDNSVNDAPSVPPFTVDLDTSDLAPGEHVLSATVTDAAGLQASADLAFEIALLPPQIDISGLRDGAELADEVVTVEVDITSQTAVSEVSFQVDDGAPQF